MTRSVLSALLLLPALAVAQEPGVTPTPSSAATPAATALPAAPEPTDSERAPDFAGTGRRIPMGGYGEIHYGNVNGPDDGAEIDLHRFIFFLGHRFDDRMAFFSEVEIEHGGEELEMEQAYLEYTWSRFFGVRGGLVLVPVGIINTYHEPPTFHGVERTLVDSVIVPTTWREGGVAVFGEPLDGLRYQVAFLNGLNAAGFSGSSGIRGGRSSTQESESNDGAVAVRLDYAPILGLDLGASYYAGGAGRQVLDESVEVRMIEADFRFQRWGFSTRGQFARGEIEGARELNAFLTSGTAPVAPIGDVFQGYYAEVAYDVLAPARPLFPMVGVNELYPFVRYENVNTQLEMADGYSADDSLARTITTAGLTWRPNPKVALKVDYQWTRTRDADPPNLWHLGAGYMF